MMLMVVLSSSSIVRFRGRMASKYVSKNSYPRMIESASPRVIHSEIGTVLVTN